MFFEIPAVLSVLLIVLSGGLGLSALVGAAMNEFANAGVLVINAVGLLFLSALNRLSFSEKGRSLTIQSATLYTLTVSLLLPVFAAIPFVMVDPSIAFGDALFESISAITTTGFTIFPEIEKVAKTLIVWRAVLQWLGGFLVMTTMAAVVVQLTMREVPIISSHAELREEYTLFERIMVTAKVLMPVYIITTVICFLLLSFAGISFFDGFCLSLATISTGGFLPNSESALITQSHSLWFVLLPFMILGATNFVIHVQAISGSALTYLRDQETQVFILIILFSTMFVTLTEAETISVLLETFFKDLFAVASLISTTGYGLGVEERLQHMPLPVALTLMLVGGSLISTAGGIKVMRIIVLITHSLRELSRLSHPSSVSLLKSGENIINQNVVSGIWITFVLTFLMIGMTSFGLAVSGVSFEDGLILAISALSNCGAVTPYLMSESIAIAEQAPMFKTVLAVAMIVGRVEILFLLPLFDRYFWGN